MRHAPLGGRAILAHLIVELNRLLLEVLLLHCLSNFLQACRRCEASVNVLVMSWSVYNQNNAEKLGTASSASHPELLGCHSKAARLCVIMHCVMQDP